MHKINLGAIPQPILAHEHASRRQRLAANLQQWTTRLLSRGVPANAKITLRQPIVPLLLLVAILGQLLLPDVTWTMLAVTLLLLLVIAYIWVQALAHGVTLTRTREGALLVVGDALDEEFQLTNQSIVPVLWVEVVDESTLPGYDVGRVVSASPQAHTRWRTNALCNKRGIYQLGGTALHLHDPLRFFEVRISYPEVTPVLIYPRVVELPPITLPQGSTDSDARTRQSIFGSIPSPTVREHQPNEGLHYVHWGATAHRGQLMVREREQEPAGDVWIVVDTATLISAPEKAKNDSPHDSPVRDAAAPDVLETSIIAAGSIVAQLLDESARRKVGIIAPSGTPAQVRILPPDNGKAHIWHAMEMLAPVQPSDASLVAMLRQARGMAGTRGTLVLVTAALDDPELVGAWTAELVRAAASNAARSGIGVSVLLITTPATAAAAAEVQSLLLRFGVPVQMLPFDAKLTPRITQRRTRRVVKTTPSGGSVTYEIEEEVG